MGEYQGNSIDEFNAVLMHSESHQKVVQVSPQISMQILPMAFHLYRTNPFTGDVSSVHVFNKDEARQIAQALNDWADNVDRIMEG